MELPKDVFDEITRLSIEGNNLLDKQHDTLKAYELFETALKLLPEPVGEWDAFAWLQSSLGECKFMEKAFMEAYEHFRQAYNAVAPNANAYILLRIGECAFELQLEHAQQFLLQAYMVAGKDIFKSENDKYYQVIEALVPPVPHVDSKSKKIQKGKTKVETKRLSGDEKERYEKNLKMAMQYCEEADWHNYFGMLQFCWNSIPVPQEEYDESFELLMVYFSSACKHGFAKEMLPYIPSMKIASPSRADIGDREYYIAIIYYECGMIDEAKEMFKIADQKSKGRAIIGKKYKTIYTEWKKKGQL